MTECAHEQFEADVDVHRLLESGQYQADVRIRCGGCQQPFRFVGIPFGVNLHGAAQGLDGEGRFAIEPSRPAPESS